MIAVQTNEKSVAPRMGSPRWPAPADPNAHRDEADAGHAREASPCDKTKRPAAPPEKFNAYEVYFGFSDD